MKSKKNIYLSIVVTSILVISSFLIGLSLSSIYQSQIINQINNLDYEVQQLQIITLLGYYSPTACDYLHSYLNELAYKNAIYSSIYNDSTLSTTNLNTIMYLRVEIWLYGNLLVSKCKTDIKDILFFYTVNNVESQEEGIELNYIYLQNTNKTIISAINANSTSPLVKDLISLYNISKFPAIVFDNKTYQGYLNYSSLKNVIFDNNSIS
ncbi:MAG: hypothetical protein QXX36_00380 [Candidatus Rehaiarchaeum fermentans]|nr:hypothetical protein [Candidatus Rehaiarchaeum fermentans]